MCITFDCTVFFDGEEYCSSCRAILEIANILRLIKAMVIKNIIFS